jgi:hypothetical protein
MDIEVIDVPRFGRNQKGNNKGMEAGEAPIGSEG